MLAEPFSTEHVDYLQRGSVPLSALSTSAGATSAPADLRRLSRIAGIGRIDKEWRRQAETRHRLVSQDLLVALSGYRIPLAFVVQRGAGGAGIYLGTWAPAREKVSGEMLDTRHSILASALDSLYPAVELSPANGQLARLPLSGLALGIPTPKPPDALDGAMPIDRLIRALSGGNWACLVLAQPVDEAAMTELRNGVINEIRSVQAAAQAERAPSPLAQHYARLLKAALKSLSSGLEVGVWRTAVYLLGEKDSYYRLASVWRGIFSGDKSVPEPVRVWDSPHAGTLAAEWAMPDAPGARGPGHVQHPLQYQTLLTSTQLAAYVHLPQLETSGFSVNTVPYFDAVPPQLKTGPAASLGEVILRTHATGTDYSVLLRDLTRHAFVAGVTGAGKTNTILQLLKQAGGSGVPFLVIEPAKTEYRALLCDEVLKGKLQVFTMGDETVSPFRLNPFETLPGTPVGVHIDLLRSVFSVSFGMWTPLPQVLEQCMHLIYADRGWDFATNTNSRVDARSDIATAFPTLSDLVSKVEEVVPGLGYDPEARDRVLGSLRTRINGLRAGGKGRMLDVQRSIPMDVLLEAPSVLELEGMGDDDDKAFVMGLLLIRLVEFRRNGGATPDLRHLLVIEEAHRLLSNVTGRASEEEADPRRKAVEAFANLLSEIRAYGQGVIVADQVPVKLAPEVIKNTNLKVAHRIVDLEDRKALAGAMAMTELQATSLATLRLGQAAVFAEGDDAPLVVQVPAVKGGPRQESPGDKAVASYMAALPALQAHRAVFLFHPWCAVKSPATNAAGAACEAARFVAENATFRRDLARLVLAAVESDSALERLWPDLMAHVQAARKPTMDEQVLLRCLVARASDWLAGRRGVQTGWSYGDTRDLGDRLQQLLLTRVEGKNPAAALAAFRALMLQLHERHFDPYPACGRICTQKPRLCLYRHAASDLIASGQSIRTWSEAELEDTDSPEGRQKFSSACQDAAQALVGASAERDTVRRAGLCFAQLMLSQSDDELPETHAVMMDDLLGEADVWLEAGNSRT